MNGIKQTMDLTEFWASIDPGLTGTGVAIWRGNNARPYKTYSIKRKIQKEYMYYIRSIMIQWDVNWVVIEEAVYFSGNVRGQISTSSGKIFKLSRFIGALEQTLDDLDIHHDLVTPMKWKGQLSKQVTEMRIRKIIPNIDIKKNNDHEFDAVGIGLNVLGKF